MVKHVDTLVLGGGLIGHLAGALLPGATIIDKRQPPANGANAAQQAGAFYLWAPLRGIPCTEIRVLTRVDGEIATPESIAAYKAKVMEPLPSPVRANGEPSYRMAQFNPEMSGWRATLPHVPIEWGCDPISINPHERVVRLMSGDAVVYRQCLSTIPLKTLMSLMPGMDKVAIELINRPVWIQNTAVGVMPFNFTSPDMLLVDYISDPCLPWYRETHQSNGTVQRESLAQFAKDAFCLRPGKLVAHPAVPELLRWMETCDLFCFGHNATWDPDELTHHTWEKLLRFVRPEDAQ